MTEEILEEKTIPQEDAPFKNELLEDKENKLKLNYSFIIGYTFCLGVGVL